MTLASPGQSRSIFTSLASEVPGYQAIETQSEKSRGEIGKDLGELALIAASGSYAQVTDNLITGARIVNDTGLILHGKGIDAAGDASLQAVEHAAVLASPFRRVPGAEQVLDVGVQLTILAGAALVKTEYATGAALGNALYDSGVYNSLAKFFGG